MASGGPIFAFVFARGGSKGLPGKNLLPVGGVPLLRRSIDVARACPAVGRIFVSTDDPAIAACARDGGAEAIERPAELAADNAPEWLAWRHAVAAAGGPEAFGTFLSLPPTAPLRNPSDVGACLARFAEGNTDVVFTVREPSSNPFFSVVTLDPEGYAHRLFEGREQIARRQDAPPAFEITPVAYVTSPRFILEKNGLFDGRIRTVEIPKERAVDIDTALDLKMARWLWQETAGTGSPLPSPQQP
jgi:N-acylneuraminate cytidylyltransferase